MAYLSGTVGRILFIRWTTIATIADMKAVLEEVRMHFQTDGQMMFVISVIPEGSSPGIPDAEVRSFINRATHLMMKYCGSIHTVIEGSSFTHSLMAGGLRAMMYVGGLKDKVFIERNIYTALDRIHQQGYVFNGKYVLRKAREMELIASVG